MAGYSNDWIVNALQAGGLTRSQRESKRLQEQQQEAQDKQIKFNQDRLLAQDQQAQAEQQAKQQEAAAKAMANKQRFYADALQRATDPQQKEAIIRGARAQGVEIAAEPMQVQLPGEQPVQAMPGNEGLAIQEAAARAPDVAMDLQAQASGRLGPPKPEDQPKPYEMPQDEISKRVELQFGFRRGTQEHQQKYAELARAEEKARLDRARAVGGAKTLPTGSVEIMSDTDTAIGLLEDVEKNFDKMVPNDSFLDQMYSRIAQHVPNSDVSIYNKQAQLAAQKAGLVLEKGKLQASDFPRYLEMLTPRPGESEATKRFKIQQAVAALKASKEGARSALGAAGYKVPEAPAPKVNPDHPVNKLIAGGMSPEEAVAEWKRQQQGSP